MVDIKITALLILVTAIFSGIVIEWQFDKDWTILSRDGEIIAKSKWVVEAERSYINKNSWYRINVMCPAIIETGGYETETRCYYAPDTYELLKRSLINTMITKLSDTVVIKIVPFYAYGTRGNYAGYIRELIRFSETDDIEEFPELYLITWNPKDTRNYKLIWRLENLDTSKQPYQADGKHYDCSYNFGNVKIDLKDECSKLDYVYIQYSKATFYFKPQRDNQLLDIDFVDPKIIEKPIKPIKTIAPKGLTTTMPEQWIITVNDTEPYNVTDVSYDGTSFKFRVITDKNISVVSKDYRRQKTIKTIDIRNDIYKIDIPANYKEIKTVDGNITATTYIRNKVILKLGDASIYITATLEIDLKIVQTGLANDTNYVASVDVSEGRLFMDSVNSSYDLTSNEVLHISFDNNDSYDYSGENNHGTATPTTLNQDKWVSGQVGNALDLPDTIDYVKVSDDVSVDVSSNISVCALVNFDTTGANRHIVSKWEAYVLRGGSGNVFYFTIYDGGSPQIVYGTSSSSSDQWYHVCGTYNETAIKIYVNGSLENTTYYSGDIDNSATDIYFGKYQDSTSNSVNGTIDNIKIYNRTLNATEILDDYQRGLAGLETNVSSTGLVLWTKLDESGTMDYATDSSGEGNTGILYGYPPEITTGNLSYGMDFDGVEDYVSISASDDTTVSYWKKNNTDTSWIHVVNSSGTIYTDGSVGSIDSIFVNKTIIGMNKTGTFFNGTIDDVRIWNTALSANEVSALYNLTVSKYNTTVHDFGQAVTYDIISNANTSVIVDIPEVDTQLSFTPTYIALNYTTMGFNTTTSNWFGQETVTVTENYLSESNLTRIRINNTYAMTQYDLYNLNLSSYISFSPNDIQNIWYDSYTGNSDNSTLKDTSDYSQFVDTCKSGNTTGQVLCLNFNELSGTTAHDRSGQNNDGTLTNMNTGVDNGTSGWTRDGKYGGGVNLYGVNEHVNCGNDVSLNFTGAFTIEAWVYFNHIDTSAFTHTIYSSYLNTTDHWDFNTNWNGDELRFGSEGSDVAGDFVTGNTHLQTGQWYYLGVTVNDSDSIALYVNGVLDNTPASSNTVYRTNGGTVRLGSQTGSNYELNGTMDEVKALNRAKSASEMLATYNLKKDYYDHLLNAEGGLTAGEDLDIIISNGTAVEPPTVTAYYQYNATNATVDFDVWTEGFVSLNWNLTDPTGINTSTCQIQVRNRDYVTNYTNMSFINDTIAPGYDVTTGYKNLTCMTEDLGGGVTKVFANMTRSYDWRPLNTAFDQDSAAHDNSYSNFGNKATKIVFHNITNTINTTFIFLADIGNQTQTVADQIFYSCNETYVSGDFTTDENCALVGAVSTNATRDVTFDYVIGALVTDENATFGGVVHTGTMYGISYCPDCSNVNNAWLTYSTNGYSGHSETSPNLGTTWSALGSEFNVILHVIDNTLLEFNLTIDDDLGNTLTDTRTDNYGVLENRAPFGDIQTDNVTGGLVSYYDIHGITEMGTIWINTTISDPNADDMNCTVYLLNNDSTPNQTLLTNYPIAGYGICPYEWDTTTIADGDYRLNVTAFDGSLTGWDESAGYIKINNIDAGNIWISPESNSTSSLWMIDFGLNGSSVTSYDDSCGTITTPNTATVNTHKNGSYALSISGEMSSLGHSERLKFGIQKYPIRFFSDSYRIFFQIATALTEDTVTQINLNVTEILDRTGLSNINTSTYRLYRVSYFGGIYNTSGICYEIPITVGS